MSRRAKRPLNQAAVKAADEEIYSKHASDPRPNPLYDADGKRQPLSATDPDQTALRTEWMDSYLAHGGEVETPTPAPAPPTKPSSPCPPCSITSQAVLPQPADRARKRIAVGEDVTLTVTPNPATWSITTGTGKLAPSTGTHSKVTFTADDNAGNVTITASGSGCTCSITLEIVAPESWTMQKQPGTNLKHHVGRPDCGWKGIMYVHPNDVNFTKIETREKDSQYVGQGSYASFTNDYHGNYPLPDRASEWFPIKRYSADGSTDDAPDTIYTALVAVAITGAAPPFNKGSGYFPITIQWRVIGNPNIHDFRVVRQEDEIFEDGKCESRKGHTERTMYTDLTSDY